MAEPNLQTELSLLRQGYRLVVGLDEVGRGAWAGPVVAGAVALPLHLGGLEGRLTGVRDSKQLSPRQRESLLPTIQRTALAVGLGFVSAAQVDRMGIVPATRQAMLLALVELGLYPDYLLIDALPLPIHIPQRAIIHGDVQCLSIAAASIVAKVTRDRWMIAQDSCYPGYGFARHKGYGTAQHRQALERWGPCLLHRLSFAPCIPHM